MNKEKLKQIIATDLRSALAVQSDRNDRIQKSIDRYEGKPYGNEVDGKSKLVWKLAKKHSIALVANVIKPFIGKEIVICEPRTQKDVYKAMLFQKLINHFWNHEFKSKKFLNTLANVMAKEGTAIARVSWKKIDRSKKIEFNNLPNELRAKYIQNGYDIKETTNGKIEVVKRNIIANYPTAEIVENEYILTEPNATSIRDSKYLIYEFETSISDLYANPLYDNNIIDSLKAKIDNSQIDFSSDVPDIHDKEDYSFDFEDKARKKITLYEYWGWLDLKGDGKTVPARAVYSKEFDMLLLAEENPYPHKRIPFVEFPLYIKEFSIWGESMAELLEDEQKLMTSIVRGIIDNMAQSNNGINFIRKNALDAENFNRLMSGNASVIEVNVSDDIRKVIYSGNFNELPASVYNLFNIIDQHSESLSGVSKFMQGIVGSEIKTAATNFSATMTQAQIRLLDVVTNIAEGLREIFYMWIYMAMEYLSDKEIEEITGLNIPELKVKETLKLKQEFGIDELPEDTKQKAMLLIIEEIEDMFSRDDVKFDITMKVGTDGLKQIKINSLNMLMQQVSGLVGSGSAPVNAIQKLLARYAELLDFPDIAKQIEEYKHQPDPLQQELAQAELMEKQAKAKKEEALAMNALARTKATEVKARKEAISTDADIANRYADIVSKLKDNNER